MFHTRRVSAEHETGPVENWPHDGLVAWATTVLGSAPSTEPVVVRATPWSTVVRWDINDGRMWGKSMCPGFAQECELLPLLADVVPAAVLAPIAADRERGWLLLPDGGETLDGQVDLATWTRVLLRYAELQQRLVGREQELLATSCRDMRPHAAVDRLEAMMDAGQVPLHQNLLSGARRAAERVDLDLVPATIQHDDLGPANVFADGRVFDWGDACLAHPFGTLLTALMADRPTRPGTSVEKAEMRSAYLRSWQAYLAESGTEVSLEALEHQADLVNALAPIARIDTWLLAPPATLDLYPDAINRWVRHLLEIEWP